MRDILRVGAVSSIVSLSTNVSIATATGFAGLVGPAAVAGYGTGARLEYLLVPLVFGLGAPVAAMVGTCIGAGHKDRALRVAWTGTAIAGGLTEVIGLTAAFFPSAWLSLFGNDPSMIETGSLYLRIVGPTYGFFGGGLALYFASQGAGRVGWAMIVAVLRVIIAAGGGWFAVTIFGGSSGLFVVIAGALVIFGLGNVAAVAAAHGLRSSAIKIGKELRHPMSVPSSETTIKSPQRSFWIAVICGAVILTIGIGARQSFGIFQKPIAADLNVGREVWSFSNALAVLLMGAFSPFVGSVADRFGTARTVAAGGIFYVIGMFMIGFATEGVMLTLGNVLCGIGMAAAGFGPIFGSISRQTPPEKRSVALGVATAGGSFGQFAIVPFASLLQYRLDNWHTTMLVLGVMSMLMVPLAFGLREQRAAGSKLGAAIPQGSKDALQEAFQTQGFWLLTIGFFVCGFHVTFIGLHFPAYIADKAIGMSFFGTPVSALELGGWAIGLVGLFNIAGSLIWGWLGKPISKEGHASAALRLACTGIHNLSRFAAYMGLGPVVLGVARVPLARHDSPYQRPRELHVRFGTYVDAMGHRVL